MMNKIIKTLFDTKTMPIKKIFKLKVIYHSISVFLTA